MINLLAEATNARQGSIWQTVTMVLVALVFFYFILWRPEQKRRKQMDKLRNTLKKGDKVTAMGIIGTALRVEDKTVILKMYDGSKVEFLKAAITEVQPSTNEDAAEVEVKNEV
jgi:preprotein translocase subunit YajC